VVFLVALVGMIALSIAFYQKAFTPVVQVTLNVDHIGNQLTPPTDVKVDGVIVGEARAVAPTATGAKVTLALDPDAARKLPSNVQARLLPKTLFGEKFVALVRPANPVGHLGAGSVIAQDQSSTARETETALNDLLPLLQTLKPDVVSTTLNAVSSAVRGRGERIGTNLQLTRDYLTQFNPELPTLAQDFAGTADLADNVNAAEPNIKTSLDNFSVISRNLVSEQQQLDSFLRTTTSVSGTLRDFVQQNAQRFVQLPAQSRPVLDTYARYAPEFPCLAKGFAMSNKTIGDAFGTLQPGLHITLEITKDNGGYAPSSDEPKYLDDRGPSCFGLPDPKVPAPDENFRDGYRDAGGSPGQTTSGSAMPTFGSVSFSTASAYRTAINGTVAPALGVDADSVPDVARVLFGPVAGGTSTGSAS
jgi:virulence factor Mce-like protein